LPVAGIGGLDAVGDDGFYYLQRDRFVLKIPDGTPLFQKFVEIHSIDPFSLLVFLVLFQEKSIKV
jgi:hypothetical protein